MVNQAWTAALFVLAPVILLAGCALELTEAGKRVNLANISATSGCESLGTVYGRGEDQEEARIDIRNKTANIGGNTVVTQDGNAIKVTGNGGRSVLRVDIEGIAYSCPDSK